MISFSILRKTKRLREFGSSSQYLDTKDPYGRQIPDTKGLDTMSLLIGRLGSQPTNLFLLLLRMILSQLHSMLKTMDSLKRKVDESYAVLPSARRSLFEWQTRQSSSPSTQHLSTCLASKFQGTASMLLNWIP